MKTAWVIGVGLLCGIAGTNAVHGQDVAVGDLGSGDGAPEKVRVVFHQGAILGIGEDALLTYTPETGSVVVQYADGKVVEGQVAPMAASPLTAGTAWIHQESVVGLKGGFPKAACSSELAGLNTAIAAVQANCRPGPSTLACGSAQTLLEHAYNDYRECVGRIQAK